MRTLSWRITVLVVLVSSQTTVALEPNWLVNIGPKDLSPQTIIFLPGVFQLDEASNRFNPLCFPMHGAWVRLGERPVPCPVEPGTNRPPEASTYKMGPGPEGTPAFVVANLGINNEQWSRMNTSARVRATGGADALKQIGQAVGLAPADQAVRWTFHSALLPMALDSEIPGSGIFFHMQDQLQKSATQFVFQNGASGLFIEAKVGMPELSLSGHATTVVTIGVTMQTEDISGKAAPLLLIVSIFQSRGAASEGIDSDGRNIFAHSSLNTDASYLVPVSGSQMSTRWPERKVFAFRIDANTVARLINAVNNTRAKQDLPMLDNRLSLVRLKQVDLRNENRFLDKGTVAITLDTEYLRASSLTRNGM